MDANTLIISTSSKSFRARRVRLVILESILFSCSMKMKRERERERERETESGKEGKRDEMKTYD